MKIVLKQEDDGRFYAYLNGKRKPTDFVNEKDFREFFGTMQNFGLYEGATLYVTNEFGSLRAVSPTYDNPCQLPKICATTAR